MSAPGKRFALPMAVLLLSIVLGAFSCAADISAPLVAKLTEDLLALSLKWEQPHVDSANVILWTPGCTADDWEDFFGTYLSEKGLTEPLFAYIGYPVFGWGPPEAHPPLQKGMYRAMLTYVLGTLGGNRTIWTDLNTNESLRLTLRHVLRFLNLFHDGPATGAEDRKALFRGHEQLVRHHRLLQASTRLDLERYPHVGFLRTQIHASLIDYALDDGRDPHALSDAARASLARLLGLQGPRRALWLRHAVLVEDNGRLNKHQLSVLTTTLDAVPAKLHNLGLVTVDEFLAPPDLYPRHQLVHRLGAVNIGGVEVGGGNGNEFPKDVSPYPVDAFCNIWFHELNHVVNGFTVEARRGEEQKQLIKRAGDDPQNYLRSIFGPGVFTGGPQEFFASIANYYLNNSALTLKLGLRRFEKSRVEPLAQFLFFADIYSGGGDSTLFFKTDLRGTVAVERVPLRRNRAKQIDGLKYGGTVYRFEYGSDGRVVKARRR